MHSKAFLSGVASIIGRAADSVVVLHNPGP